MARSNATPFALVIAGAFACSSGSDQGTDRLVIAAYAGDGQSVIATLPVPVAPAVRVTSGGAPVAGDTVVFAIADSGGPTGGALTGAVSVSDANGVAAVGSWVPGSVGTHSLSASLKGSSLAPVLFSATSTSYPLQVNVDAGGGQSAPVGTPVTTPPRVLVRLLVSGTGLVPVNGATVTFSVGSGGGSITGAVTTTDANGLASVGSWTLGPNPGSNTLNVVVSPLPDVQATITATGTP